MLPWLFFFFLIANDCPFLSREVHHFHMWPLIMGRPWAHPTWGGVKVRGGNEAVMVKGGSSVPGSTAGLVPSTRQVGFPH